jgi:hypothetical protein
VVGVVKEKRERSALAAELSDGGTSQGSFHSWTITTSASFSDASRSMSGEKVST